MSLHPEQKTSAGFWHPAAVQPLPGSAVVRPEQGSSRGRDLHARVAGAEPPGGDPRAVQQQQELLGEVCGVAEPGILGQGA
jgi:hypothetical protein